MTNKIEDIEKKITKRMAKGEDNAHRIGSGTFLNPLDKRILKEEIATALLSHEKALLTELMGEVESQSVYYRSKFSRDCTSMETEAEKSTEMVLLSDITNLLTSKLERLTK